MGTACMFFEASTTCTRCRQPLPINGAAESILCATCQTPFALAPATWQKMIGSEILAITGMAETEGRTSTMMMGEITVQAKFGRLAARCSTCKTKFDDGAMRAASAAGSMACPSCQKKVSVRSAPAWLKAMQPIAELVVGETIAAVAAASDARAGQPTSIHCIQCGAGMQIDGKERLFNCKYCNGQIYLPDDLWLRIHPAIVSEAWFIVLDLGGAIGALATDGPNGLDSLRAMTTDPRGNFILAYEADEKGGAGHTSRIACVDRRGLLLWVQDGIEFDDYATLVPSPPDGNVLLADRTQATARMIDSRTGQPMRTIGDRTADARRAQNDEAKTPMGAPLDMHDQRGVAIDYDGSIVVVREWGPHERRSLRRFAPDGSSVPLWPTKPQRLHDAYPGWDSIGNAPQTMPDSNARVVLGWDGCTYFVGDRAFAKLARDGRLFGAIQFPEQLVESIRAFGVDRAGNAYALFTHAQRIGDSTYAHMLRILPDGRFVVWLGPHATPSNFLTSTSARMSVLPDGTILLADSARLRVIAPNGAVVWRSSQAVSDDEYEVRRLAERRAPKRVARDLEG